MSFNLIIAFSLSFGFGQLLKAQEKLEKDERSKTLFESMSDSFNTGLADGASLRRRVFGWNEETIDGLASADIGDTLAKFLRKVVAEGSDKLERQLVSCLKNCVNVHGTSNFRTKSVQLGLEYVRQLGKLSPEDLQHLVEATDRSEEVLRLFRENRAEKAIPIAKSVVATRERLLGVDSVSVALSYSRLATLQTVVAELKAARQNFEVAKQCWNNSAFEMHPFLSVILNNQATIAVLLGIEEQRIQFFKKAQEIAIRTTGKDTLDYLYPTIQLAGYYMDHGQTDKAFAIHNSVEESMMRLGQAEQQLMLEFLKMRVAKHFLANEPKKSLRSIDELIKYATEKSEQNPAQQVRTMSEIGFVLIALGQKDQVKQVLDLIDTTSFEQHSAKIRIADCYGRLGLLNLQVGDSKKAYPYIKKAVEIAKEFFEGQEFAAMKTRDQLNFKLGSSWVFNNYFDLALIANANAKEISDVALDWKGAVYLNESNTWKQKLSTDALIDSLPENSVFVNFIEFTRSGLSNVGFSFVEESLLLAIVLEPGKQPRCCPVGKNDEIRALVEQWRQGTTNPKATLQAQKDAARSAMKLRELVWDPLKLDLPKESLVIISPDASVGNFAFGALPNADGTGYLIEDYRFLLVPVPQLALKSKAADRVPVTRDFLAIGDVDYGKDPENKSHANKPKDLKRSILRGGSGKLEKLVFSKKEIESAAGYYPASSRLVLGGAEASEKKFRQLAAESRNILISTHGFCQWRSNPRFNVARTATYSQRLLNNLDLKSGLAFSNSNESLALRKSDFNVPLVANDGVLYSKEIESLDLSNVELAVLSACTTGSGAPTGSEGVIGLSRSFQIAGVQNTVATLWNVNDEATSKITVKFFELMQRDKLPAIDAIRKAQVWAIHHPKEVASIDKPRLNLLGEKLRDGLSPYYWSPFVISGSIPSKLEK